MKINYFLLAAVFLPAFVASAQMPAAFKWTGPREVVFSYDGTYTDSACFSLRIPSSLKSVPKRTEGVSAPERYADFPLKPEGAQNLSYSPDSTRLAFTRGGDLWVADIATGEQTRLTQDGSETVMNGYASWVYYEEILGRPSRYKAFWWSPDSRRIAFYRFDDGPVPVFPIYSPFGQDGTLLNTRYPKAGEKNPEVSVGFAEVSDGSIRWADFDPSEDQYFGTPFWSADSRVFYVPREPRIQNTLDLFAVDPDDGSKKAIYHEEVPTWLDWISGMLFGPDGLWMVRDFESGWQQIYYLSYDGKTLRRLTDGPNWRVTLLRAEKDGTLFFTAERDSHVRESLYKLSPKGEIVRLSDPALHIESVSFAPDGKHFITRSSNLQTPPQLRLHDLRGNSFLIASAEKAEGPAATLVSIMVDGLELPGILYYPDGFDPERKYPVHVDVYGGPDTPLVRDRWVSPSRYGWYARNGIIELVADCRAAGHNGRAGIDAVYRRLTLCEADDFIAWAKWLRSLPYVKAEKIGVEGFSFGGTMATLLVSTASEYFPYAIAGGGVYDWRLYDTHYTERFMSTPEDNPDGYARTRVLDRLESYPVKAGKADGSVMLRLTHGTADDNVHFQHSLQLIDALQRMGAGFELMIYPDGKHGYGAYQGRHFEEENRAFWKKYLLEENR